jgi:dGTPase
VRSGLITLEQVREVPLFGLHRRETLADHPAAAGRRLLYEGIRRMLSALVYDVIARPAPRSMPCAPASADAARARRTAGGFQRCGAVASSRELKRFLFATCTGIRA